MGDNRQVPATTSRRSADPVLAAAVDLARDAAEEVAEPGQVGEHVSFALDAERLGTHHFACLTPGYRGWVWSVTLSRVPRARTATVCEVVLVPGEEALLAPEWVPWSERLRPGDLGVGDLLPTTADDDRLETGWLAGGVDEADQLALVELGLGRPRVLSYLGRQDAVARWWDGDFGPTSSMAQAAPATCSGCGFMIPMSGALRAAFGVCANAYSPADGRVVALSYGCGGHSEAAVLPGARPAEPPRLDEVGFDVVGAQQDAEHGSVSAAEPAEDLGHS